MSKLIDLTNTPTTNSTREEWDVRNKPPHQSITLAELQQAREMALAIPPSLKQQLLSPLHLCIRDFIDMNTRLRAKLFSTAGFSNGPLWLNVDGASISSTNPLVLMDYGFVFMDEGEVMLGQVLVMYTKGGGKAGRHASQLTTTNIASMS
ncbi:hypothetical protein BDN71DRAFT_1585807 [Pleurotus eryngii]|uniref:Uncharacterized protein n=1 Tax=Pleurotus eryngii TaxID=5323 RepID=A0A9P6A7T1_PLEER|nr:hypothetical protein BDN71DRAFT_1585807 [Pleurotus eryngii]